MSRKVWIPILAAVLVLCTVAVILLFQLRTDDPSDGSTETAGELDLKKMLATADQMLSSGDVITMNNHEYLIYLVNFSAEHYPEAFSHTDETYSIHTAKLAISAEPAEDRSLEWYEQNTLRYLLLLTQVIEQTPSDCFYLFGPLIPDLTASVVVPPILYICPEYRAAGYGSAKEFWNKKDEKPYPYYGFALSGIDIYHYKDKGNYYLELIS